MALLVSDDLWAAVEPLLPPARPKPNGGRPRVPDRAALAGILFVLRTGIQWHELPGEPGCCGKTCWRRLRDWHAAGVWSALHRALLERLHGAGQLDWGRAALDSASLAAKRGVLRRGRTRPTVASRAASMASRPSIRLAQRRRSADRRGRHLVVDARGTPLGVALSGANRHDSKMLAATLDAVPPVRSGKRGRPRRRPAKLHADKAHDHRRCRRECRARGIRPVHRGAMDRAARHRE